MVLCDRVLAVEHDVTEDVVQGALVVVAVV